MEYGPFDNSGTDDDLPPSHPNRMSRGARVAGNGRSGALNSIPYSRAHGEIDMESQIHLLEQEAYISVLRAFKAQADAITWEKESLITELRKELRLSNEEHRELIGKVNADGVIRRIREWRQAGGIHSGMLTTGQATNDPLPSPSVIASRKKQKINQSVPSQSFRGPSPFLPTMTTSNQPSFSAARQAPITGTKGKKQKSGNVLPGASSMNVQYPPPGPTTKVPLGARSLSGVAASGPCEGASFSPLVGKKVRTRWPDDNHFYEAVITDYDHIKDLHALVYDMKTVHETWEWVNLNEISPDDIQWVDEDPGISRLGGYEGSGVGLNRSDGRELVPDSLLKEVERVFGGTHIDPFEVEKAKKILKDHEQALMDAITRLANFSDGENDQGRYFMNIQQMQ
ncbi:ENT domain-containing protein [Heracleum sosnowskyi]|uniref:ENT domain-containing protein n=1 Tax=Heracleum sosnowskyi TaxID=360622 RepID=A0AAD8HED4_9APIA|nr:ENT domain-containing protein [Heracleum sosnowskyi]